MKAKIEIPEESEMKRMEKVKAAIAHQPLADIPSCIHLDGDGLKKYGDRLFERYVKGKLLEKYQNGFLSRTHAMYYGMGNHVLTVNCPWWDWYDVPDSYQEFDAPEELPKTIGRGSYEEFVRQIQSIKEYTDAYVLVTIWGSHFEKAYFARGIENFLADLAGEPEFAGRLLNFIIHKNMVMLENIVHIPGIDGILLGSDWGSQKDLLMSPDIWRELIRPGEEKEYRLIHDAGLDVWVHSCGDIRRILPDLAEMGVDVLNPLQPECMDIERIKKEFGDRIAFWGGISTQQILPFGTCQEVREETRRVAALLSPNGGYLTAPSQEIQKDVPFENLCALIDTARELAGMEDSEA